MSEKIFEITHDSLAAKIWEKISAEEKGLMEVRNFITSQGEIYKLRKELLSKKNIAYILPYLDKLSLNDSEAEFIRKSRRFHTRQRIIFFIGIAAIFLVLSIGLVVTVQSKNEAVKAETEKAASLNSLQREHDMRQKIEVEELFRKASAYMEAGENADQVVQEILSKDSSDATQQRIEQLTKLNAR